MVKLTTKISGKEYKFETTEALLKQLKDDSAKTSKELESIGTTYKKLKKKKTPWFSTHKPEPPSEEAIKMHNEMMKKLLPLIKEVFPDMGLEKDANKKNLTSLPSS